jgi:hypothetical protein
MEYFRNYRGGYVRKIKDRLYKYFNLFDGHQLNKNSSIEQCNIWKARSEVEAARQQLFSLIDSENSDPSDIDPEDSITHMENIISDIFSDDELKIESNITFGMVVITMMLDPNYQRGDIDSAELANRMENWSGAPWDNKVKIRLINFVY